VAAQSAHNLIGGPVRKDAPDKIRREEVERVRGALLRAHWPRLQMMIIVSLTGATGFVTSVALLHFHLDALWLRYPLAVAAAYLVFLFLLWCWLRLRGDDLFDAVDIPGPGSGSSPASGSGSGKSFEGGGGHSGGGGASGQFEGSPVASEGGGDGGALSDATAGFDLDIGEAAVLLVVLAALLAGAWFAIGVVWVAPDLFAELVIDAALAGGLYRRLRGIRGDHWLRTAFRLTAWRFASVAFFFCVAGFAIHLHSPEAKSIGQAFHGTKQEAAR
jgi:hypothetical protein